MGNGSGSGSAVPPNANVPRLQTPQWFLDAAQRVQNSIRNAKTLKDVFVAAAQMGENGVRLSRWADMQRQGGNPDTMQQALLATQPSEAPKEIRLDPVLKQQLDGLFQDHVKEGAHERGATLVLNQNGGFELANAGRGPGNVFYPNLKVDGSLSPVGTFHTHLGIDPAKFDDSGKRAVSSQAPGGDDFAYAMKHGLDVNVVRATNKDYMFVRTAATPAGTDTDAVAAKYQKDYNAARHEGNRIHGYDKITPLLAAKLATNYGFAYYEGKDGVFTRVSPP